MDFSEGSSSEILGRLSTAYGVETQKQLAEKLGVSAANVSNWVQRNSVPGSAFVRCALDTGCDLAWLATGKFAKANLVQALCKKPSNSGKLLIDTMLVSGGKIVLNRVLNAYGFKTQKELSDYFSISTATISTWIRREYFPGEIVIACALDTGVPLEWLALGQSLNKEQNITSDHFVKIDKYNLESGDLIRCGETVLDLNDLSEALVTSNLAKVHDSEKSYLVSFSTTNLFNGVWLLGVGNIFDVYEVSILPANKIKVIQGAASFVCELKDVTVKGLIISECRLL